MSGRSGFRGYLVQTMIGLLEAFADDEWVTVTFEPSEADEKADIVWTYSGNKRKAVQVKHSQNQVNKTAVELWSTTLKNSVKADSYEIWFAAPTTTNEISNGHVHEGVKISPPKILDIDAFSEQAAQRLDTFLESKNLWKVPSFARLMVIRALSAQLANFSTKGKELARNEFENQLLAWVRVSYPSGVEDAAEELRHKLEFEVRRQQAETRYRMKHEACLNALNIVDLLWAHGLDLLPKSDQLDMPRVWSQVRHIHNNLVVSCESENAIKMFRSAIGLEGPLSGDRIVDLRAAIRAELGFGSEAIDEDRSNAWIATVDVSFELPDETKGKLLEIKNKYSLS